MYKANRWYKKFAFLPKTVIEVVPGTKELSIRKIWLRTVYMRISKGLKTPIPVIEYANIETIESAWLQECLDAILNLGYPRKEAETNAKHLLRKFGVVVPPAQAVESEIKPVVV